MHPPNEPKPFSTGDEKLKTSSMELDSVGAIIIVLYQNQRSLSERLWASFNQCSALLLIVGMALGIYLNSAQGTISRWILFIPPILYIAFAAENRRAMSLTLDELRRISNIASTKTPYNFKEVNEVATLWFHSLSVVFVLALYALACYSIAG